MEYWHEMLTEKSWKVLQGIREKFSFILIGGWATYLWTRSHKSKDIDIIIDFSTLEKLKTEYELRKNDSLKKYEIMIEEIDIDIYVPYYSKLTLPIEDIKKEVTTIESFKVVKPEVLLILKQGSHLERNHSEKGAKDTLDIMSLLLNTDLDFSKYRRLLAKHNLENYYNKLTSLIKSFDRFDIFGLNPRQYKLKKNKLLEKLKEK